MALVHVPVDDENTTVVSPGGIDQSWVYAPALEDYLKRILNELKIMNIHNAMITGQQINQEDIDED